MEQSLGIAVVGSGITGLTAADHLVKAGRDVVLFDKGRGSGGRIATRRSQNGVFDHGAPALQAAGPEFRAFLASLGAVSDQNHAYYGVPSMRSLLDPLVENLDIRQAIEVAQITRLENRWALTSTSGTTFAPFDAVIVTTPAPQAARLVAKVGAEMLADISSVNMQPVWTVMVEFAGAPALPGMVGGKGAVLRADRMSSKPMRADHREDWVIHMTPAFTQDHLSCEREEIAPFLLETFCKTYDLQAPAVRYLRAHRWRFAFADRPLGRPYLGTAENGLLVGGDWTLGARAEHGYQSGLEMAKALLFSETVTG